MTLIDKIAWDDTVLPFQLDRSDVRGRIARLDGVLSGVLKQHDYPSGPRHRLTQLDIAISPWGPLRVYLSTSYTR